MAITRDDIVEENLDRCLDELSDVPGAPLPAGTPLTGDSGLTAGAAVELFTDQLRSRALDIVARELKAAGRGYYTISSAGHEDNVVLGALLRPTDPCLLHYRSGALMMARARRGAADGIETDPIDDTLRSLTAAADDPISGGRHKVWGSRPLLVVPQTSTIASHLPRAVGMAFAQGRARRLAIETAVPADAIVLCSFGDASLNHASALAAVNAARYAHRRGSPVPILFLCEDNHIGISVDTPPDWVARSIQGLPGLTYVRAAGELDDIWAATARAVATCRSRRGPVFLHLPTVRLLGHAGSDVEAGYRELVAIEADEARDPLLRTARHLVATGAATVGGLRALVARTREHVRSRAEALADSPPLRTASAVMAPLTVSDPDAVASDAAGALDIDMRRASFGHELPEHATAAVRRTLAAQLNAALTDELARRPELLVFGEDVARKGGVYHVTAGLLRRFGQGRVFDTLLDETTILGVAQGAGMLGMLPVPEIQYLAYLHNALDQIRGEAASLAFFSAGQFRNPMVVRVAAFAYQRGFGGHFHNDNAIGALRDIPGLVIAAPARGEDAPRMLRGALALAAVDGRVVVFLEPIALYHERDLHAEGDGGWLSDYPPPGNALLPGEVGIHNAHADDLLIVTYANGLRLSLRAAARLADEDGLQARVLDLRWLAPLAHDAVARHAAECSTVLVADECRATGGGIADAIIARLAEDGHDGPVGSVRSRDSYVPLGPAADTVLLGEDDIVTAARSLTASDRPRSARTHP